MPGEFDRPAGVAVGPDGTVFVADRFNQRVQYFSAAGAYLGEWGAEGYEDGEFFYPSDVAVTEDGVVFVADTENDRIQYFQPRKGR